MLGPVLLNGMMGCETCGDGPHYFTILDYKVFPRKIDETYVAGPRIDSLALNDSIQYNQLEFMLVGEDAMVGSSSHSKGGAYLMACSQVPISVDTIRRFTVTCNQLYKSGLGKGNDVTDLFTIGYYQDNQKSIANHLGDQYFGAYNLYTLRLTQAPEKSGSYQFQFNIDWGKGKSVSLLTRPIMINK